MMLVNRQPHTSEYLLASLAVLVLLVMGIFSFHRYHQRQSFMYAIFSEDLASVKLQIDKGVDVDFQMGRDYSCVRRLSGIGTKSFRRFSKMYETPLSFAVERRALCASRLAHPRAEDALRIVSVLLDAGADPNRWLFADIGDSAPLVAAELDFDAVKLLIDSGARVDFEVDPGYWYLSHITFGLMTLDSRARTAEDKLRLFRVVADASRKLKDDDGPGINTLATLCIHSRPETIDLSYQMAEYLLEKGANAQATIGGQTLFHVVGIPSVVEHLEVLEDGVERILKLVKNHEPSGPAPKEPRN